MKKNVLRRTVSIILCVIIALIIIAPFYIVALYSVKSKAEMAASRLAWPTHIEWSNFSRGIVVSNFWRCFKNSLITTVATLTILLAVCPMAAYKIARKRSFFYSAIYYLFLGAMILPFQSIMTPLYVNLKNLHLINTLAGQILTKAGFQIAFTVIIITGFVKTISYSLEEAAAIDGANPYTVFARVILPLLKPIILSSVVLNVMNIWNDFQISVVVLQKPAVRTLPLTQYYFFGGKQLQLNLAFSIFILSMIPVVTVYLLSQRYIISGITAGAVKG